MNPLIRLCNELDHVSPLTQQRSNAQRGHPGLNPKSVQSNFKKPSSLNPEQESFTCCPSFLPREACLRITLSSRPIHAFQAFLKPFRTGVPEFLMDRADSGTECEQPPRRTERREAKRCLRSLRIWPFMQATVRSMPSMHALDSEDASLEEKCHYCEARIPPRRSVSCPSCPTIRSQWPR